MFPETTREAWLLAMMIWLGTFKGTKFSFNQILLKFSSQSLTVFLEISVGSAPVHHQLHISVKKVAVQSSCCPLTPKPFEFQFRFERMLQFLATEHTTAQRPPWSRTLMIASWLLIQATSVSWYCRISLQLSTPSPIPPTSDSPDLFSSGCSHMCPTGNTLSA